MKINLIRIGNSEGIRIPKAFIKQCGLAGSLELLPQRGALIIRAAKKPREGWLEAFRQMAEQKDDALLDTESVFETEWEKTEWKW